VQLCAVSVDLDEVHHYRALHGLAASGAEHAVYDVALGRMREFAAQLGIPLTLFAVASDLGRAENAQRLRAMLADGHELGNHSLDHLYDLTLRDAAEQRKQVEGANARFSEVLGVRPLGFRAPGYTVSDELLATVRDCGMAYDSSVFPCPPYYAAKATALLAMKVRGKRSRSVLDSPKVLRAPRSPYRIGQPYWTPGAGLLELPIQVAGPLRLPFIGTLLTLLGARAARLVTRTVLGQPLVNLELHGIDFLDAKDVPGELGRVQPDLKVAWARKREALSAVLELLRASGYAFVRLDEAARAFS
jgi:peptidoglycan-N-acetylglucosamine deacetylase